MVTWGTMGLFEAKSAIFLMVTNGSHVGHNHKTAVKHSITKKRKENE